MKNDRGKQAQPTRLTKTAHIQDSSNLPYSVAFILNFEFAAKAALKHIFNVANDTHCRQIPGY